MKKLFLILVLCLCSLASWAQNNYDFSDNSTGQTLYYKITDAANHTVEVTYPGTMDDWEPWDGFTELTGELVIPSSVTNSGTTYSVTGIGAYSFLGCIRLTHVIIPEPVSYIGLSAFDHCGLDSITLPNSLTSIGNRAFSSSAIRKATLPESVNYIGNYAFEDCELLRLHIPHYVSNIEAYAFLRTYLVLYCSSSRPSNNWGAQRMCCAIQDSLYFRDADMTILSGCESGLTVANIPSTVTTIAEYAFANCYNLVSVNIPSSVTNIGDDAFYNCSYLPNVTIPNSVTSIGSNAFAACAELDTIWYCGESGGRPWGATDCHCICTLQDSLYYADSNMTIVTGCVPGLTVANIPSTVTTIEVHAFYGCSSLASVTIPTSVTSLEKGVFQDCSNLTNITIPNSVTTIGDFAFTGCSSLTSITIPNSVTVIGRAAFFECSSLTTVTISDSVTSIGSSAFRSCSSLTSLTIPNSVTTIEYSAFSGCSSLTNITIPDSVTTIGMNAFKGCSSLTSVTIPNSVTIIEEDAFSGVDKIVYCGTAEGQPWGAHNIYGALQDSLFFQDCDMTIVNGFADGLTTADIPNTVTTIADNAFKNCSTLTSVIIPSSVTTIGGYAFSGCTGLTSVTFPSSMTYIPAGSFYNCSGLESITIPNSVTEIRREAFMGCSGLTSVSIGSSVTKINEQAFRGCSNVATLYYNAKRLNTTGSSSWISTTDTTVGFRPMHLRNVVIGDSVETLPDYVFPYQSRLVSITIPNSVRAIGGNAFRYDDNLTNVTLPNMITTINGSTFYGCSSLQSIVIPSSVTSIGSLAFDGCNSLKTVYNLSNMTFTKGATDNGYVAKNALRVLSKNNGFSDYGTGSNTLHQISTDDYTIVEEERDVDNEIPRSTVPANFIYYYNGAKDGSGWKANEIFLTDDTSRFVAPVAFTAEKATYTREFTNSNRSTLYLPFTAAVPEGFEVYDFAGFDGHTLTFSNHEGDIAAYTPYLVGYNLSKDGNTTQCTIMQENVAFPASSSAAAPAPINGMTFQGTTVRTCMTDNNYGYRDGFFVQSARVSNNHNTHAHVNPFRAYFTYSPSSDAPQSLPPTLNVEVSYGDPVGIDAVETPEQEYDGRYGNDVYDMLGRLVRKNADNLEGLPKGVYIWKGKKLVVS